MDNTWGRDPNLKTQNRNMNRVMFLYQMYNIATLGMGAEGGNSGNF